MNIQAAALCRRTKLFSLALLLLAAAGLSFAQSQKSAISGNVTDQSGAVLRGAEVSVSSKDLHVKTNEEGLFYISDVPPGQYELKITYVGFTPLTQIVNVVGGQTASVSAKLQVESKSQTVIVTAPRVTGEAEAINVERSADNILQVLPAEVIRSLPNANMADALGRMPGITLERDEGEGKYVQIRGTEPRLTNTTVDGVNLPSPEPGVRQIKFDAIPADLVQEVQVNKTLLANMDGDAATLKKPVPSASVSERARSLV